MPLPMANALWIPIIDQSVAGGIEEVERTDQPESEREQPDGEADDKARPG